VLAPVASTSPDNPGAGDTLSVTATCPAGKKVLGGGFTYSLSNASRTDRVAPVASYPSAANAWTATIRVNAGLGGGVSATLSVYVVCTV
jgi:hypothetical protein